jgi:hypothetical protein
MKLFREISGCCRLVSRLEANHAEGFYGYSIAIGTLFGKYEENLPLTLTDTPHKEI